MIKTILETTGLFYITRNPGWGERCDPFVPWVNILRTKAKYQVFCIED